MPVPQYRAPKDSQPWGLLGAIGRFLSPPGYTPSGPLAQASARAAASQAGSGFVLGRPAGATEVSSAIAGAERQEPTVPDRIRFAPTVPVLPPTGVTPIVRGTLDGVTPDRTQSDEYKAQMAQYGALQKAKKFDEAEKLGMEIWQQKYGKTPLGQPGGVVGARNPLMEKMFGYQKGASVTEPSYAASASQVQPVGSVDFAVAANAVPAPWNQQGVKVSSDFAGVVPFQAAKTTGEGMPAFQTTGEKAEEFLRNVKLGSLF